MKYLAMEWLGRDVLLFLSCIALNVFEELQLCIRARDTLSRGIDVMCRQNARDGTSSAFSSFLPLLRFLSS